MKRAVDENDPRTKKLIGYILEIFAGKCSLEEALESLPGDVPIYLTLGRALEVYEERLLQSAREANGTRHIDVSNPIRSIAESCFRRYQCNNKAVA